VQQCVQQNSAHSTTSSARASSVGGTSRPSALAVVRLMTSSNLVGYSIGRSAGFAWHEMSRTAGSLAPARSANYPTAAAAGCTSVRPGRSSPRKSRRLQDRATDIR